MAEKKKIFNESDFDKDKQLFTSEDFEKNKDVEVATEAPSPNPKKSIFDKINETIKSHKLIFGAIAVSAICLLGYGTYSVITQSDENTKIIGGVTAGGTTDGGTAAGGTTDDGVAKGSQDNGSKPESLANDNGDQKANNAGAETSEEEQKPSEPAKPESTSKDMDEPNVPIASISGSVEENARRVIHGDFGNGAARKQRLGDQYSEIQAKVNEIYRQKKVTNVSLSD